MINEDLGRAEAIGIVCAAIDEAPADPDRVLDAVALLLDVTAVAPDETVGAYFARLLGEPCEPAEDVADKNSSLTDCPIDSCVGQLSRDVIDAGAVILAGLHNAGGDARLEAAVRQACRRSLQCFMYG